MMTPSNRLCSRINYASSTPLSFYLFSGNKMNNHINSPQQQFQPPNPLVPLLPVTCNLLPATCNLPPGVLRMKQPTIPSIFKDVLKILNIKRGTVYFDGVWTQAAEPAQRQLLKVMAQRDDAWTLAQLEAATTLGPDSLRRQLRWAERHDILKKIDADPAAWQFHVPLMRRWIRKRS